MELPNTSTATANWKDDYAETASTYQNGDPVMFDDRVTAAGPACAAARASLSADHVRLYKALGGNEEWRIKWFKRITTVFLVDTLRQTVNNLRRDGTLWKWSTWKSAASYLFGARGLIRQTYKPWREYKRADFHPRQLESTLSERWLADNRERYSPVGA